MRGPPARMLKDMLTVEIVSPGAEDPLTGASTTQTVTTYLKQSCADEDILPRDRARFMANGINGVLGASYCYTRWFKWPEVQEGQSVVIRINGRERKSLKQGPPADLGGQHKMSVFYLDGPTESDAP